MPVIIIPSATAHPAIPFWLHAVLGFAIPALKDVAELAGTPPQVAEAIEIIAQWIDGKLEGTADAPVA